LDENIIDIPARYMNKRSEDISWFFTSRTIDLSLRNNKVEKQYLGQARTEESAAVENILDRHELKNPQLFI